MRESLTRHYSFNRWYDILEALDEYAYKLPDEFPDDIAREIGISQFIDYLCTPTPFIKVRELILNSSDLTDEEVDQLIEEFRLDEI